MIQMCEDLASPEASVECSSPVTTLPGFSYSMPFTGFDVLWLLLVAVFIIGFGWWLIRRARAEVDAD